MPLPGRTCQRREPLLHTPDTPSPLLPCATPPSPPFPRSPCAPAGACLSPSRSRSRCPGPAATAGTVEASTLIPLRARVRAAGRPDRSGPGQRCSRHAVGAEPVIRSPAASPDQRMATDRIHGPCSSSRMRGGSDRDVGAPGGQGRPDLGDPVRAPGGGASLRICGIPAGPPRPLRQL